MNQQGRVAKSEMSGMNGEGGKKGDQSYGMRRGLSGETKHFVQGQSTVIHIQILLGHTASETQITDEE